MQMLNRYLTVAWRWPWCVVCATSYQLLTNPFALALVLALAGHWRVGAGLLVAHTILCIGAVLTAKEHASPLTGLPIRSPLPGNPFWLSGNDQDGLWVDWHRATYPKALRWLAPFMWTWWRNKLRNLPFVPWLAWLHVPQGDIVTRERRAGGVLLRLRTQGWMAELEYFTRTRFGDFGPRLDQPDSWGAVSWAFRPWGKL